MKTVVLKVSLSKEEDGRWSVTVPGLPGCSAGGIRSKRRWPAAEVFIEDMIEAGQNLEAFSGPIEVIAERGKQGAPHETP